MCTGYHCRPPVTHAPPHLLPCHGRLEGPVRGRTHHHGPSSYGPSPSLSTVACTTIITTAASPRRSGECRLRRSRMPAGGFRFLSLWSCLCTSIVSRKVDTAAARKARVGIHPVALPWTSMPQRRNATLCDDSLPPWHHILGWEGAADYHLLLTVQREGVVWAAPPESAQPDPS